MTPNEEATLGDDRIPSHMRLPIMSGEGSRRMWKHIGRVRGRKKRMAVYHLGCRCQELEALLRHALVRIKELESRG